MKVFTVIWFTIVLFCVYGWVNNVVKLANCDFEPSYKAEVIHGVGILIPPVGFVVGYMDLGK